MSDSNEFGSFFAGFVIGGLVGAAVALLMAPQSGEETRTVIRDKSIELKDMAVESGQETLARAEQAVEDARTAADQSVDELRERIDELARVAKEKTTELQASLGGPPAEGVGEAAVEEVVIEEDPGLSEA